MHAVSSGNCAVFIKVFRMIQDAYTEREDQVSDTQSTDVPTIHQPWWLILVDNLFQMTESRHTPAALLLEGSLEGSPL